MQNYSVTLTEAAFKELPWIGGLNFKKDVPYLILGHIGEKLLITNRDKWFSKEENVEPVDNSDLLDIYPRHCRFYKLEDFEA